METRPQQPEWSAKVQMLRSIEHMPSAQASSRLLAQAEDRWRGRVVARTSHVDLLFTIPGDSYPFSEQVRVSWSDGVYEFWLQTHRSGIVTADRCRETNAPAVLDSFLAQLVGDPQE